MKTQVTIERRRACFRGTYGMRNAITRTVKIKSEKDIQIIANVVARNEGCGSATEIRFAKTDVAYVADHTRYGYRKITTGQYVPNKYVRNFGWKNTYYQNAETVVVLPISLVEQFLV